MKQALLIIIIFTLFSAPNLYAGFNYSYDRDYSSIVAAIEIEDKGIYNLIVSVTFLGKPQTSKLYKSDEYEKLLDRLQIEWRGVALHKILESKNIKVADLLNLKNNIHSEIVNLAEQLKKKFVPGKDVEVVFSIHNFYLLEPRER